MTAGALAATRVAWVAHALLLIAAAATVALAVPASPWRELAAGAAVLPLLLVWPGLRRVERRTLQRLAVLLVVYAGLAAGEVVARAGGSYAAGAALLAALLELGAVLIVIRRRPAPAARTAP